MGGTIYDLAGWQGVTAYHSICQGILLLMFCLQPALKNSFVEVFFGVKEDPEEDPKTETEESGQNAFSQVVPGEAAPPASLPCVVDEVETIEMEDDLKGTKRESEDLNEIPAEHRMSAWSETHRRSTSSAKRMSARSANRMSARSETHRMSTSSAKRMSARSANRMSARSETHRMSTSSAQVSNATSAVTTGTHRTGRTPTTVMTSLSRMTSLSKAGMDFRHHFGTAGALQPQIVGATGAKAALRDVETWHVDGDGNVEEQEGLVPTKRARIPKDVRLPAFLIVLNCFCSTASYVIEFSTFAIFFKQEHNWNVAIFASFAQTAGDVMAAIAMQVIPAIFPDNFDEDEAGPIRRFFHYMVSQPYTLTTTLLTWVLFNAGMMSPWLPLAIVAQVFMGSSYVYSSKWSTDMNLFYSLGDSNVFLTLQVYCRNAEAIGGSISGLLGTYLFTLNPIAPFAFSTGLAFLSLVLYTVGFCARLGFGDDIEAAEARRSRRKGVKRVSSWLSDAEKVDVAGGRVSHT